MMRIIRERLHKVLLGRVSVLIATVLAAASFTSQGGVFAADRVYEIYKAQSDDIRAARDANDDAHNYAEAVRLWRKIDAGGEVDVAFPGIIPDDTQQNFTRLGERLTANRLAYEYAGNIAWARYQIGLHYMKGLGVPQQDYAEAVRWYHKSNNTRFGRRGASKEWLGFLYAYGLGVPKDGSKARELWADKPSYIRLLDHNLLPKRFADLEGFDWKAATAKMDAADAAKEAAATRAYMAAHPGPSAGGRRPADNAGPSEPPAAPSAPSGPSWFACKHVLGAMGGMMGCSPW